MTPSSVAKSHPLESAAAAAAAEYKTLFHKIIGPGHRDPFKSQTCRQGSVGRSRSDVNTNAPSTNKRCYIFTIGLIRIRIKCLAPLLEWMWMSMTDALMTDRMYT